MGSTTVHSKSTVSIAGSAFKATENTLEIPPKAQVFEVIPSYVEEQGNIEIPAGGGFLTNKNELIAGGKILPMKNPNAFENIANRERKGYEEAYR